MARFVVPVMVLLLLGVGIYVWDLQNTPDLEEFENSGESTQEARLDDRATRRGQNHRSTSGSPQSGRAGSQDPGLDANEADAPLLAPFISGRVVDSEGEPIEGAIIRLKPQGQPWSGFLSGGANSANWVVLKSRSDGRFAKSRLPARTNYAVLIRHPEFKDHRDDVRLAEDSAIEWGDIELSAGLEIRGLVVNENNEPMPGVEVSAEVAPLRRSTDIGSQILSRALNAGDHRSTLTDEYGRFSLRGLEEGEAIVRADTHDRPVVASSRIKLREGEAVPELTLTLKTGRTVSGNITNVVGKPIAGVLVKATRSSGTRSSRMMRPNRGSGRRGAAAREAISDDDGNFSIVGLDEAPVRLALSKQGYLESKNEIVPADKDFVELKLKASPTVKGIAVDVNNSPITSKIEISIRSLSRTAGAPAGALVGEEAARRLGIPDEPGLFAVVDLRGTRVEFAIRADGYAEKTASVTNLKPGDVYSERYALQAEFLLTGIVRNPEGLPQAGVKVRAAKDSGDSLKNRSMDFGQLLRGDDHASGGASAKSDKDGRFALRGLEKGNYEVTAEHQDYAKGESQKVSLIKPKTEIEILLIAGAKLTGTVRDDHGEIVVGAYVKLTEDDPNAGNEDRVRRLLGGAMKGNLAARTQTGGRYEFKVLNPGNYRLTVSREKAASDATAGFAALLSGASGTKDKDQGEAVSLVSGGHLVRNLVLVRKAEISGVVRANGVPQADVKLILRSLGRGEQATMLSLLGGKTATTNKDGQYKFEEVEGGEYRVELTLPGRNTKISESVSVAKGGTAQADLELPGASIKGQITDRSTRRPISGVAISFEALNPNRENVNRGNLGASPFDFAGMVGRGAAQIRSDAQGNFEILYIEAGTYSLSLSKPGYESVVSRAIVVASSGAELADFQMVTGGQLVVTVNRGGSNAHAFASVRLKRIDSETKFETTQFGVVGAEINFLSLVSGRYEVIASVERDSQTTTVDVVSGETKRVRLDL
ncbi:MAG: carboxypeptidase-like regulatory domain-containing protein [Planctomycetota bacterium]